MTDGVIRPVAAGTADLLASGGREVAGGGAVVGRAPRADDRAGGPSVRGLIWIAWLVQKRSGRTVLKGEGGGGGITEGRAVKGTASALRFNPDTSAIVGLFLGEVRLAVEAVAFSLFSGMRGEKVCGLVRGAGGVVRALGWRRPLLLPGVLEETSRDICKSNTESGENVLFRRKDALVVQTMRRDLLVMAEAVTAAAAAAAAAASSIASAESLPMDAVGRKLEEAVGRGPYRNTEFRADNTHTRTK